MQLSVVILAAGNGKRMMSCLPKVLHSLGGSPLLLHVINAAKQLKPKHTFVVYSGQHQEVKERLQNADVQWIMQPEPMGTGHALLQVLPYLSSNEKVLILYGDVPLIQPATLEKLVTQTGPHELGLLTACLENPGGFGRIIRDDEESVVAIIEQKDATAEQLSICEINTGIMTAQASLFQKWLPQIGNSNAQGEFYLTDCVALAVQDHVKIRDFLASCNIEISGVNDRVELIKLERFYQQRLAKTLLMQGVTIIDPERFDCRGQASIAQDVQIDINVILEGDVHIGQGSYIGANSILKNVTIGKHVHIKPSSIIEDAVIADGCMIGPFARIRPNTRLSTEVHVGNFVELKNTQIESGSKVNHLTYLGDTVVGKNVNVGAGTITCNYDGVNKNTTVIKDGAFIGSGTELVAPLTVGEGAYIAAGSTITKDAPQEALTIARTKQITLKNWKKSLKSE